MTTHAEAGPAGLPHASVNAVPSRRDLIALHGTIIILCIVLGGALSFTRGQDICFDQLNYHYYSAYAYETNRLSQDVAPAQVVHNFFSPIIYLPFYFMVTHLPPRLVGMALGALQGLNIWLVFVIARIVTRTLPASTRLITVIAAVAVSGASPMAISELGTSIADLLVSLPVLAGVALLMHADFAERSTARTTATIILSGALLGAATSLKLTSAAFAIGLMAAAFIGWDNWRQRLGAVLATGLGGLVGFIAVGGSWYLLMWRMFRNPVFPYFNTVFRSPDFPSETALFDARFVPPSLVDALSYPFLWTQIQNTTAEPLFRDVRFALLVVLGIGVAALLLISRGRLPRTTSRAGCRLIVFFGVAFVLWMYEWSIQRYIVSLELLAGPAIMVLLQWSGLFEVIRGRTLPLTALMLALTVLCLATVKAPDWGHIGWRKTWYAVDVPTMPGPPPIFFFDDAPLSYIVPALPPQSAAIEVSNFEDVPSWGDTVFLRRIHALLAERPERPIWAVASERPPSDRFKTAIAKYGLQIGGTCQTTKGRPYPLTWCPLARISPPA